MIELLGWAGSWALALSGVHEAFKSIKTKRCELGWPILLLWFWGEVFSLGYVLIKNQEVSLLPLLLNYGINLVTVGTMVFYKRKSK